VTLARKIISLTIANLGYRSHTIFNNISIVLLFLLAIVEYLLGFLVGYWPSRYPWVSHWPCGCHDVGGFFLFSRKGV